MPMLAALQALVSRIEQQTEQPLPDDEREWLSSITSADDLVSLPPDDGTGRFAALAYDAALALGLERWDAGSVAGDH